MVKEKFHGSRQSSHWRSKLEISVALVDGAFDVAAVCDGQVLTMSWRRCSDIVTTGKCAL